MPNTQPYCGDKVWNIGNYYRKNIYINITIPVCLVGMILNLLNLLVFTRKTMNSSPNLILANLAFVDFLVLLTRIACSWMEFVRLENGFHLEDEEYYELTQLVVYWYSIISIETFQFISAVLTVQLAAWRYIAVVHPLTERHWCNKKITRNALITGYVMCCVLLAIPFRLSHDIDARSVDGETKYIRTSKRHPMINLIRRYIYGLVVKALPSVALVGFTSRIVITLLARKTRHEQLTSSASTQSNIQNAEKGQQTNRSTAILLAVAALFSIAEFPRGILSLMRTINHDDWNKCYHSLKWMFVTIININTSITFLVYYALSQQFRTTFKSLFSRNPCTSITHQTHAPLAILGDTKETDPGYKISEV